MKIELPVVSVNGWEPENVVNAEIVDVAPHLPNGTFAVHPTIVTDAHFGKWTVTNIETGCMVARGKNRPEAILNARARCLPQTPGALERAFKNFRRRGL